MNIQTVDQAFTFMRQDGSQSQCLVDCINAYATSKAELEGLFYKWCWSNEDEVHLVGDDLAYSIELGKIEEWLVERGLIYSVD